MLSIWAATKTKARKINAGDKVTLIKV